MDEVPAESRALTGPVTTPVVEAGQDPHDGPPAHELISVRRRWVMLAAGTAAQAASAAMVTGPAFLIPVLHDRHGMSLAEAGLVAGAPMAGMTLFLVL
jgi:hypothetical protein